MQDNDKHETLGDNVVPTNYNLVFVPNVKSFKFNGSAAISVKIKKATRSIRLNAKDLQVKEAIVRAKGVEQKARLSLNKKREELTLLLGKPVSGNAEIAIEFIGTHNDRLYGFYRSKYLHGNKTEYMLTTQFEAPNARAAFPCFDEPEFKAAFDVTLIIDKRLMALSNMPVKSTKPIGKDRKSISFQTTPRMSTYLLYMGVGNFEYLSGKAGKTPIRVFTTPGKKKFAKLPLDYCVKLLAAQEKYFGIKFALPKLDLIAVPDFAAGAMENWGAITFRETQLLGDERQTAVTIKQGIAITISHELVHQWFGDLVTMKWWNDIWLNESFATFMGVKIADMIHPEWKLMLRYFQDTFADAFEEDSLKSTHPINVRVNTPGEIGSIFDSISYDKGGSILYMLEDFVGNEVFRKGLHRYLKEHAYSNAIRYDLWDSIQKEAKLSGMSVPAAEVMKKWVDQPGHPVVAVKKDGDGCIIEQKRYSLLNENLPGLWTIPIKYRSEGRERRFVMRGSRHAIKGIGPWVKLNYGQSGFYRVSYDDDLLNRLGRQIDANALGAADVWGIEDDLFELARSSRIPARVYLDFVGRHLMECEYPTNLSVIGHLLWMMAITKGRPFEYKAKQVSIAFNRRLLSKLGWSIRDGESPVDTRMRGAAIRALGESDDRETLSTATRMFDEFVSGKAPLDTNLRVAVYCLAAKEKNDIPTYNKLMQMYGDHSQLPEEKLKAMIAVSSFKDPTILAMALRDSLTNKIRLQDSGYVIGGVGGNPLGKEIFFDWATRNWKRLMAAYDPEAHQLDRVVGTMGVFADAEHKKAIEQFFRKRSNMRDDIKREVSKTLERVEANIRFLEQNK